MRVEPSPVLEADTGEQARVGEPTLPVQGKGSGMITGDRDDGDHLPDSRVAAPGEQFVEQPAADTPPAAHGATYTESSTVCR